MAITDESIACRAGHSVSLYYYGFATFDSDPDDWFGIYLTGAGE